MVVCFSEGNLIKEEESGRKHERLGTTLRRVPSIGGY